MNIQEFNATPSAELAPHLAACVSIPAFSSAVLNQRPYVNRAHLLEAAQANINIWTDEDVTTALSHHPRIGEKKAASKLSASEEAYSNKEQAGITATDTSAWEAANASYEEKFGHVFLIRAAGRSSDEMLAELTRRMNNTKTAEAGERKQQLGEISLLRLEQLVTA